MKAESDTGGGVSPGVESGTGPAAGRTSTQTGSERTGPEEWIIVEGYDSIAPYYGGPIGDPAIGLWVEDAAHAMRFPSEPAARAVIEASPERFDHCKARRRSECINKETP